MLCGLLYRKFPQSVVLNTGEDFDLRALPPFHENFLRVDNHSNVILEHGVKPIGREREAIFHIVVFYIMLALILAPYAPILCQYLDSFALYITPKAAGRVRTDNRAAMSNDNENIAANADIDINDYLTSLKGREFFEAFPLRTPAIKQEPFEFLAALKLLFCSIFRLNFTQVRPAYDEVTLNIFSICGRHYTCVVRDHQRTL
jgi:hypothetical protein